jgi:hypothetical protein
VYTGHQIVWYHKKSLSSLKYEIYIEIFLCWKPFDPWIFMQNLNTYMSYNTYHFYSLCTVHL